MPAGPVYSVVASVPASDLRSMLADQEPCRARPVRRSGPSRPRNASARRADAFCLRRGLVHLSACRSLLAKGDWAQARPLVERGTAEYRKRNIFIGLPHAVASSARILAQVGEASEALNHLREGEELLKRRIAGGAIDQAGMDYQWLGRALWCLTGSTMHGGWPIAPSKILHRTPAPPPMHCTCWATS
jgi:hypothetical protein